MTSERIWIRDLELVTVIGRHELVFHGSSRFLEKKQSQFLDHVPNKYELIKN